MNSDLQRAKAILEEQGFSCVLCKGQEIRSSRLRGVQPLLLLLDSGTPCTGFSAADKVVGRATAFLYRLLRVQAVHGSVISRGAVEVLEEAGITASWDVMTERISNRTNTGPCPMEAAVLGLSDPEEALAAVRHKVQQLKRTAES